MRMWNTWPRAHHLHGLSPLPSVSFQPCQSCCPGLPTAPTTPAGSSSRMILQGCSPSKAYLNAISAPTLHKLLWSSASCLPLHNPAQAAWVPLSELGLAVVVLLCLLW
ncbi:unnamed protein product [Rangifer tarandus platyrhynchus]|uniref:Uncharacterized protein n=1 Tax=Rangifer tarandus platyrhynchus TaxID=3082113 RepID=A0AC59YIC2_RANTA